MSSNNLGELRATLGAEVQANQSAVDAFDERAATILGINRTDMRCLEHLLSAGEAAPTELGAHLGLTTGSVTAMLDRLEKLGYLTRSPDPGDRRRVVVRATEVIRDRAGGIYQPMVEEGDRLTVDYTEEELELVIGFLRLTRGIYERQLERVRTIEPYVKRRR
ncbi:MarR family transcriptional regulator [Phytomonospora sp. NPDC050363]|uniref:MarR family winged helix-turn-helix transcriptional regulator n=1 Tax=Phytomonospora sp. NPDC050363 TaxID=3155642 RepID=UPI0033CBB4C3